MISEFILMHEMYFIFNQKFNENVYLHSDAIIEFLKNKEKRFFLVSTEFIQYSIQYFYILIKLNTYTC